MAPRFGLHLCPKAVDMAKAGTILARPVWARLSVSALKNSVYGKNGFAKTVTACSFRAAPAADQGQGMASFGDRREGSMLPIALAGELAGRLGVLANSPSLPGLCVSSVAGGRAKFAAALALPYRNSGGIAPLRLDRRSSAVQGKGITPRPRNVTRLQAAKPAGRTTVKSFQSSRRTLAKTIFGPRIFLMTICRSSTCKTSFSSGTRFRVS